MQGRNCRVSSSRPSRQVHGGGFSRGRIAAVEDLVFRLAFDRLEGQPAEIARPELQDAQRDQLPISRGDDDVVAVGPNLAVVEELDDDDRIRLRRRHGHLPDGVELGPAAAERLGGSMDRLAEATANEAADMPTASQRL